MGACRRRGGTRRDLSAYGGHIPSAYGGRCKKDGHRSPCVNGRLQAPWRNKAGFVRLRRSHPFRLRRAMQKGWASKSLRDLRCLFADRALRKQAFDGPANEKAPQLRCDAHPFCGKGGIRTRDTPVGVYRFSRPAPSATRPPFLPKKRAPSSAPSVLGRRIELLLRD